MKNLCIEYVLTRKIYFFEVRGTIYSNPGSEKIGGLVWVLFCLQRQAAKYGGGGKRNTGSNPGLFTYPYTYFVSILG